MILRGEVRFQAMDAAQMNFAAFDHAEKDRKTAGCARGADALAGGRLRHIVAAHEKMEQRWMPVPGPKFAAVDDVDVAEQACNALVILPHQFAELFE